MMYNIFKRKSEISSIFCFFPEYIITICTGRSHFLIDDKLVQTGRGKKLYKMEVHDVKSKFDLNKVEYNIDFDAKDEQIQVALSVIKGRNVLGLLPTGFGKTLCMVIPTIVSTDSRTIILVISPLTSLIEDQMSTLQKWNLHCAKLSTIPDMEKDTIKGI